MATGRQNRIKDHRFQSQRFPWTQAGPGWGPMTAADFQMEGSRLLALGLPCFPTESDWAETGRAGSLTPQDSHRTQTGRLKGTLLNSRTSLMCLVSSLLPARDRANRSLLPQTMSLSSHPKEIQLATPEPVVNSHQTAFKRKTIHETPPQTPLIFAPPTHTPCLLAQLP